MALKPDASSDISRFFASIKSLNELDRHEVRNVVNGGLLGDLTNRENYSLLNYNRAVLSVELLLISPRKTSIPNLYMTNSFRSSKPRSANRKL